MGAEADSGDMVLMLTDEGFPMHEKAPVAWQSPPASELICCSPAGALSQMGIL